MFTKSSYRFLIYSVNCVRLFSLLVAKMFQHGNIKFYIELGKIFGETLEMLEAVYVEIVVKKRFE